MLICFKVTRWILFGNAWDHTQSLAHIRQVLDHWAASTAGQKFSTKNKDTGKKNHINFYFGRVE